MTDTPALRQELKRLRLGLAPEARAEAESSIWQKILGMPRFRRARRIAGYIGVNGEIDPTALVEHAAALGKACYLPVLHPFRPGRLWFCQWRPGDRLIPNRFGIPEPVVRADRLLAARNLDLVIVPLLGFDNACHRLGMGGGYYDRSFAFVRRVQHARRPLLLGVAHEIQHVDALRAQPWDISLDAVVTDHMIYRNASTR